MQQELRRSDGRTLMNNPLIMVPPDPDPAAGEDQLKLLVKHYLDIKGNQITSTEDVNLVDFIVTISLKATKYIIPEASEGDEMNPLSYIKIKCIASGTLTQSEVIKGIAFRKNAACKGMGRTIVNPNILLLKGDLDRSDSGLSSLDPLSKENNRMKNLFKKMVMTCRPDVIFVEKRLPSDIRKLLSINNILLVDDMKQNYLERISQQTGSTANSLSDVLKEPKFISCDLFCTQNYVEVHDDPTGEKETNMTYLEGFQRPLGCTILLQGANTKELKKVKNVLRYTVCAAYHLTIESTFYEDQRVFLNDKVAPKVAASTDPHRVTGSTQEKSTDTDKELAACEVCMEEWSMDSNDSKTLLILMTSHCITKQSVCEQSLYKRITYYGYCDISLGRFLQYMLLGQGWSCSACKEPQDVHEHRYTHKNGDLIVNVRCLGSEHHLPGENEGKIWMWCRCLKCEDKTGIPEATQRVVMSPSACMLSFGKFLGLGFSSKSSARSLSICGHLLHQDCLRFFGLGSKVAMFWYNPVEVFTAFKPPAFIEFNNPNRQGRLKDEIKENLMGSMEKGDTIEDATDDLVNLNWAYQDLVLRAYVWDHRLNHILYRPGEEQGGTEKTQENPLTEDAENWSWVPYTELCATYRNEILNFHQTKFFVVNAYTPKYLHSFLNEEMGPIRFSVGPDGNVLSVCEDEISSIISCALATSEIKRNNTCSIGSALEKCDSLLSIGAWPSSDLVDSAEPQNNQHSGLFDEDLHPEVVVHGMIRLEGKYTVGCIYAEDFYRLRKKCCKSEAKFIISLSRCTKWDAQGGKSKAFFAKTNDERFIIKEINRSELESFMIFKKEYFKYVNESMDSRIPTALAKILGIYEVQQMRSGKVMKNHLVVMENLLFGKSIVRTYDLKGAVYDRYTQSSGSSDDSQKVFLDQNFLHDMRHSPFYLSVTSKQLLENAVWNDTAFLNSIEVMDYSLLVGIDKQQHELVFGIIDYLRKYTWDKRLETRAKSALVVPRNLTPTIVPPKEYKQRFRKFMNTNFLTVPDSWSKECAAAASCKSPGLKESIADV